MRILIIGAGGHGQVVADIFLAQLKSGAADVELIGFLDDDLTLHQTSPLGLPVLAAIADLPAIEHEAVIVAIGDNHTRRKISEQLQAQKTQFATAIHPAAIIGSRVTVGAGTVICAGVVVNTGTHLGQGCILNTGCSADHHNRIGDYVHIGPGAHLGGEVVVGPGALVGIGAAVMPRRQLGAWSVIGAGAVVTGDIPARATAVGVPARVVK